MRKNHRLGSQQGIISKAYYVLYVLNDSDRLKIIGHVRRKTEMTAGEISETVNKDRGNVSKQIRMLATIGVLNCRREGKYLHYSLNSRRINQIGRATQILNDYET